MPFFFIDYAALLFYLFHFRHYFAATTFIFGRHFADFFFAFRFLDFFSFSLIIFRH